MSIPKANRVDRAQLLVHHTVIPDNYEIGDELGKGSNNRVCEVDMGKKGKFVIRIPRRQSDTQQEGSALWECRHTLRAAELGVGPAVKNVWIARHQKRHFPSGLYMIMSKFDYDLDDVLIDKPELKDVFLSHKETIVDQVVRCLNTLAKDHLFVYDLKPSNVVVTMDVSSKPTIKIIDYGRDFCEWGGLGDAPDSNTPVITMLRKRLLQERGCIDKEADSIISHILFAAMLVALSSTTTFRLYNERRDHRMSLKERQEVNVFAAVTKQLLDSMQGQNKDLLREVLRLDDVRGVFRHYHGRRNAGTRRTLMFAVGVEREVMGR